ncbi:hypothetical protein F2Q69_00060831 [Brassica cretica]|uniref:Uncharacterized protein n=1 Tax=Brassica cretica TaxID=69181 RepID=A0A8S9RIG6_BRACR|nr:hypothetical protein F2Q69_00060831 [Brassica cretica]
MTGRTGSLCRVFLVLMYHKSQGARDLAKVSFSSVSSLWLEKVHVPELFSSTVPLRDLEKMHLILYDCEWKLCPSSLLLSLYTFFDDTRSPYRILFPASLLHVSFEFHVNIFTPP